MKTTLRLAMFCALAAAAPAAAPQVNAIVNAASYKASGLPNSAIAQGSMFVVFGAGMGPAQLAQAPGLPLLTTLAGVSVRVTVGSVAVDAFPVYVSANQLAAVLPSTTPAGIGLLSVTYDGHTSEPGAFRIAPSAPGILTQNQAGSGLALAQNFNSEADQPRNALTRAAHPGQVVTLWATGLGPIAGSDAAAPIAQNLNLNLQVMVGSKAAKVRYEGRSGCCAGIDQVQFEVPAGVEGCYVPVTVRVDDAVSNFATLAVAAAGDVCTDINGLSGADLERWQAGADVASGIVTLFTGRDCEDYYPCDDASGVPLIETVSANFIRTGLSFSRVQPTPPPGSCLVTAGGPVSLIGSTNTAPLDAGAALTVAGPKGAMTIPLQATGNYYRLFSNSSAQIQYLEPGAYAIDNGSGGADVGPFRATLTVPPAFTATTQSSLAGVKVAWTGGDPGGNVTVSGSASSASRSSISFICTERVAAGQFAIPQEVLLSLPATPGINATSGVTATFKARGLDFGTLFFLR